VRKEVNAAERRSHHQQTSKTLPHNGAGTTRSGLKLVALVCILGTAAYLLFTWETTEPRQIQARQLSETRNVAVPQEALHDPLPSLPIPTAAEGSPRVPAAESSTKLELLAELPAALAKASPEQSITARKLLDFAASGQMSDINGVNREAVTSLAELLITELGSNAVAAALESQLGWPAAFFRANPNPAEAIADLFEAVRTESDAADARPVLFSDRVEPDGTVTGNVHVIPAGTKRVFAAFENQGAVQGLDRVLAVWRNPSDDRMVFTEFEPVRTGSTYNFVWLELEDGWPAGFYKLDLFHPHNTTQLLASRSFNVR
jgi:hypothetical protein